MLLSQDQEMVRDAVRDFAREQLWPNAGRWDKEHHFPKEAHQGLAELGAYGICVPEEVWRRQPRLSDAGAGARRNRGRRWRDQHRDQCDQLPGQRGPDGLWQRHAKEAVVDAIGPRARCWAALH